MVVLSTKWRFLGQERELGESREVVMRLSNWRLGGSHPRLSGLPLRLGPCSPALKSSKPAQKRLGGPRLLTQR